MSFFNNTKSIVWNFFKYDDAVKVKCNLCSCLISRGGIGKKASTTPLLNHLRNKHSDVYENSFSANKTVTSDFADKNVDHPNTSLKKIIASQPTLEAVLQKKKVWDINHPKSVELHYAIAQMIAVDNQPYSFVEDEGFRNMMAKAQPQYKIPSREYFKQNILPKMYTECKEEIRTLILSSENISLTTDMWTNSVNKDSFISFTAHWIDGDFNYRHAVLNARHFPGSHKSEYISKMLTEMITEWNITNKIYLVIRDSGSNIVKGVEDLNLKSESCFLHNLHLIVTDALNSQRAVTDIVAIGRKIVGHFNHSSLACSHFKQIQEEQLHLTYKKLVQDISIRWNSTYYMLSRLLELKSALSIYVNENNVVPTFSSNQWTLIENCLILLQPFHDVTKAISSSKSLISEVIPMVVTLNKYLSDSVEVYGLGTMKGCLQKNTDKRFSSIHENEHFSIATILDPRFKMLFFPAEHTEVVKTSVLALMKEEKETSILLNSSKDHQKESHTRSKPKASNGDSNGKNNCKSFWDCFKEISASSKSDVVDNNEYNHVDEAALFQELNDYLMKPVIDRKISPFTWWKINATNFPILSKLVKKYLSSPASSIYSERLFSEAGLIYEKKCNRILPKNAEQLLFLHHNLPILKKD